MLKLLNGVRRLAWEPFYNTVEWSAAPENFDYFFEGDGRNYVVDVLEIHSVAELQQYLGVIQPGDLAYLGNKAHAIVVSKITATDMLYTAHDESRFDGSITELYFNKENNPKLTVFLMKDVF